MNSFTLVFPLEISTKENFSISSNVIIEENTQTLVIPGCNVEFKICRQPSVEHLSEIFKEHHEISLEEETSLNKHQSLLCLLGTIKSPNELSMVNCSILKILEAGALGVYMQQSGTAFTKKTFCEELEEDFPMNPWINFIQRKNILYTLGMETFSLPDLCVSTAEDDLQQKQELLSIVADALFIEGINSKSGTEVDALEHGVFILRTEINNPYSKNDFEYNKNGILRLIKK